MATFWFRLPWKEKSKKETSLYYKWVEYRILWQNWGIQQFIVLVDWDYFNCVCDIYLSYMADEFGWYETMARAKWAVETYLTNVLHYNFDEDGE